MIEQDLRDDPYAQEKFSQLLRKAIEETEKLFDHPLKQYLLFHTFEEQVKARKLDELPEAVTGNRHVQAYYGVFRKVMPAVFTSIDAAAQARWVALAFSIDQIVESAVAENSINSQNIEADIRKKLLPVLFRECKAAGFGMDQASAIIEWVIQITRVGLSGL
jgi:type I restriction enzyme R subunit